MNTLDGERSQILGLYGAARAQYLEWLRRQIVDHNRIDLLATHVLGYQLEPFHRQMLRFQFEHTNNLQLVGRGFGKSTICTVTKAIHYLCKYPKARIVIASKTVKQSQARLKEISSHLAENQLLIELFGEFYNKSLWNAREIEIAQRHDPKYRDSPGAKSSDATPTIACVGAKGSIAGAHFDIEFSDDLIDKTNSHTELTREEVNEWYNATFTPMIDPPDPAIPFRGHRHRVGTRYHHLDQYGHWIEQARAAHKAGARPDQRMWINVIPAIDYRDTSADPLAGEGLGIYVGRGTGRSPWPSRWSTDVLLERKAQIGSLAFEAQYLNDISGMTGDIFNYDDFVETPHEEAEALFREMSFYIGCDLAISEKESADDCAFVVVGVHRKNPKEKDSAHFYVVDLFHGKLRFAQQTHKIKELHDRWNSIGNGVKAIGIETVAYQLAQYQSLQDTYPEIKSKLRKISPKAGDDKVSRAWRRTPLLESKRVHLLTVSTDGGENYHTPAWKLREQMVLLPHGDNDDLWDGFDHAITVSMKGGRARRDRDREVKLI